MTARRWNCCVTLAAMLVGGLMVASTARAQLPAVAQYGGFAEGSLGYAKLGFRDGFAAFGGGSFAGPLPTLSKMGFQLDADIGTIDGKAFGGGGAWIFWRDPAQGMFGFGGMAASYVNTTISRLGARGEYYLDRLTLGGFAGYQLSDQDGCCAIRAPGGGVVLGQASYYFTDNFKVYGGAGYIADHGVGRLGVEYKPTWSPQFAGWTTFADGGISSAAGTMLFGLRYSFGSGKPLIREEREDYVDSGLTNLAVGVRYAF